jgi:hypothetical protein
MAPPAKAPAPTVAQPVSTPAAKPLLLDDLRLDSQQNRLLYEAEELAVSHCMRDRGFAYEPQPYDEDERDQQRVAERIDPNDPKAARAVGYGLAMGIERSLSPDAKLAKVETSNRAELPNQPYRNALLGSLPTAGFNPRAPEETLKQHPNIGMEQTENQLVLWDKNSCTSQGEREVWGDNARKQYLNMMLTELSMKIERSVEEDTNVASALDAWRHCMSDAGYKYVGLNDARKELADSYHQGKMTLAQLQQRELEIAPIDLECRQQAKLLDAQQLARKTATTTVSLKYAPTLTEYATLSDNAVQRSRALLGI